MAPLAPLDPPLNNVSANTRGKGKTLQQNCSDYCHVCNEQAAEDTVTCDICKNHIHYLCTGVPKEAVAVWHYPIQRLGLHHMSVLWTVSSFPPSGHMPSGRPWHFMLYDTSKPQFRRSVTFRNLLHKKSSKI